MCPLAQSEKIMDQNTLISGLIAAFFVQLFQLAREHFFKRNEVINERLKTVILVSSHLDSFALKCAEGISEENIDPTGRYHPGRVAAGLPNLPAWQSDVSLSLLPHDLLSEVVALPIRVKLAEDRIDLVHHYSGPEDAVNESDEQCALCGFEAIVLARKLRRFAKLPDPVYQKYHWDFGKFLQDRHAIIVERLAKKKKEA